MTPTNPQQEAQTSEARHTPGPWRVNSGRNSLYPYSVDAASGERIVAWGGICRKASREGQANAHLIAAAPDMLAALKDAKREIEYLCEQSTLRLNIVRTRQAYLNISEAISKAEEQP